MKSKSGGRISRRSVLKKAAAAAAVLGGGDTFARGQVSAPAIGTNTQAGRKVRAFVKYSANPASVEEMTLRALTGREIVVRTQAVQCCYTELELALVQGIPVSRGGKPNIIGHGSVGIVEAVGPQAIRVEVGDRVIVIEHSQCGRCHNCLRMRADKCLNFSTSDASPIADMGNTAVWGPHGGITEVGVVNEEHVVPVFTDYDAALLCSLTCVSACGLGMATTLAPVEMASDVVVLGCGPVGLSAIQGAKIKGAAQIIGVEPIKYRRDLAVKAGAHIVLDPNVEGDNLVRKIQDLCRYKIAKTDRLWAGGGNVGPDHVIEAVGGERLAPKVERGPDPTGVLSLQQAWDLGSMIGSIVTCGVGQPDDAKVKFRGSQWADGAKHHLPGTYGGCNGRRDMPRYVRLIEAGMLDMRILGPTTFPIERVKDAYQATADRTVINTAVVFNT